MLGPIVEEGALTQSTAAVVAVGQVAVELEQVDNLAVVQIVGAVVAVVHRTAALVALAAMEALVALGPLAALEALEALGPLVALEVLAALGDLVALDLAVLGLLAALEALVETKQGNFVRPCYIVVVPVQN